ncbi:hypothetical protein P9867_016090 [Acinetobacter baumannii]|uniref:Uncharacterized protein n=1 Tax=Acinetobacter baumannii TaxID=470 RepID=A0AA90KP52_ACIBA|nr:hypothetical protein [Acinetobacter baumannii]MEC5497931.1 hypothetical protein [Acinetobacter baumannii]
MTKQTSYSTELKADEVETTQALDPRDTIMMRTLTEEELELVSGGNVVKAKQ